MLKTRIISTPIQFLLHFLCWPSSVRNEKVETINIRDPTK